MGNCRYDSNTRYSKALDKKGREGHGYKLYMDNFFSSPDLFDDLTKQKINCCRPVQPTRKGMPIDMLLPNERLKRRDIWSRKRDDLTAIVWRDKRDVCTDKYAQTTSNRRQLL
jgi:hypothetical protein